MKARNPKAKVFGTFAVNDQGEEILIGYAEAFSKPSAQKKNLDDRIVTREATHRDMMEIGQLGIVVDWMPEVDDPQQKLEGLDAADSKIE